jgi:hypothetical protein
LKPGQFTEVYARKFRAVEIDSTYSNIPAPQVGVFGNASRSLGSVRPDCAGRMRRIDTLPKRLDLQSIASVYARFIGDRKDIEAKNRHWDTGTM